jgi:hypothetical protein
VHAASSRWERGEIAIANIQTAGIESLPVWDCYRQELLQPIALLVSNLVHATEISNFLPHPTLNSLSFFTIKQDSRCAKMHLLEEKNTIFALLEMFSLGANEQTTSFAALSAHTFSGTKRNALTQVHILKHIFDRFPLA